MTYLLAASPRNLLLIPAWSMTGSVPVPVGRPTAALSSLTLPAEQAQLLAATEHIRVVQRDSLKARLLFFFSNSHITNIDSRQSVLQSISDYKKQNTKPKNEKEAEVSEVKCCGLTSGVYFPVHPSKTKVSVRVWI